MIRVIVVDDSPVVRTLIKEILSSDSEIEVVDTACDPYDAREKIKLHNPDVITLDVEMPKMDGVTFLKNIMRLRPMPVVMISSLTEKGADVTLEALELGAVDYIAKPKANLRQGLLDYSQLLIGKVKAAAKIDARAIDRKSEQDTSSLNQASNKNAKKFSGDYDLLAIGASTGGTEAIKDLLLSLPPQLPPIVIVQHIPPVFSTSYARRLNRVLSSEVVEVMESNIRLVPGYIYLAPGDRHLKIKKRGRGYVTELLDGEPVNRHKPSVDVLFDSVAKYSRERALGVILTGMGQDGAQGLLNMRESGSHTIAQDKESSVVWGMPGVAVQKGAAIDVLSLKRIGPKVVKLLEGVNV